MRDPRFYASAAFYVLALAAQVSGFTSGRVAILLAIIATALLVLAVFHTINEARAKRGEPLLSLRHPVLASLATATVLVTGYFLITIFWGFWLPNDGDEVEPLIGVTSTYITPRDPKTEVPILATVWELLATDTKLQHECRYGEITFSNSVMDAAQTAKTIKRVAWIASAKPLETCDPKALPKTDPTENFFSFPAPDGFLYDAQERV